MVYYCRFCPEKTETPTPAFHERGWERIGWLAGGYPDMDLTRQRSHQSAWVTEEEFSKERADTAFEHAVSELRRKLPYYRSTTVDGVKPLYPDLPIEVPSEILAEMRRVADTIHATPGPHNATEGGERDYLSPRRPGEHWFSAELQKGNQKRTRVISFWRKFEKPRQVSFSNWEYGEWIHVPCLPYRDYAEWEENGRRFRQFVHQTEPTEI